MRRAPVEAADESTAMVDGERPSKLSTADASALSWRNCMCVAVPACICATIILVNVGLVSVAVTPDAVSPLLPPSTPPRSPTVTTPRPSPPSTPPRAPKVPLIIDTDLAFDVDDVGALCVAHALANNNEAELLAVIHDAGPPEGIGAVSAINEYHRRPTILGAYKGVFGANTPGPYVGKLAHGFATPVTNYTQVPSCASAYRQALTKAAYRSVTIAAIGYTMCLRDLLSSPADALSPLNGSQLVADKVKAIVFQGGWYQPLHEDGHGTFNWDCGGPWVEPDTGCTGATKFVIDHLPESVQLIYSDMGDEVYHGAALTDCAPVESPCREAYLRYLGPRVPRQSWDPIVVVVAVRGPGGIYGHLTESGWRNRVDESGANHWAPTTLNDTLQSQFVFDGAYPWAQSRFLASRLLDRLLCRDEIGTGWIYSEGYAIES